MVTAVGYFDSFCSRKGFSVVQYDCEFPWLLGGPIRLKVSRRALRVNNNDTQAALEWLVAKNQGGATHAKLACDSSDGELTVVLDR